MWDYFTEQVAKELKYPDKNKWNNEFSPVVKEHIANYVEKQYGGEHDVLSQQSPQDAITACNIAIAKYKARQGRNQREYNDGRDCVKRAHYAQLRAQYRGKILDSDINEAILAFNDWAALGE